MTGDRAPEFPSSTPPPPATKPATPIFPPTPTITVTNTPTTVVGATATRPFIDRWFCDGIIEIDGDQITCYPR